MKICNDCKRELPEDSGFCQYCGSKNISIVQPQNNSKAFKRCIDCGKELPMDSDFCQYCGSKRVAIINDLNTDKTSDSISSDDCKKYKKRFTIAVIIAVCSLCGLFYFASMYSEVNSNISTYISKNESLEKQLSTKESELKSAKSTASTYQTKANYYDTIKNNAGSSSNSNFFATQTVLKNPKKTRVVFYIPYSGQYSVNWSYSSGITTTSGNTSSGLVYMDVTYNGSGVGTIVCTNTVNNSKITIYCLGS